MENVGVVIALIFVLSLSIAYFVIEIIITQFKTREFNNTLMYLMTDLLIAILFFVGMVNSGGSIVVYLFGGIALVLLTKLYFTYKKMNGYTYYLFVLSVLLIALYYNVMFII